MESPSPVFRDDFQLKENHFTLAERSTELDPRRKRAMTICNLWVNHNLSISSIARVLDEDEAKVVEVLIENGIVYDRRRILGRPPWGIERRIANLRPKEEAAAGKSSAKGLHEGPRPARDES